MSDCPSDKSASACDDVDQPSLWTDELFGLRFWDTGLDRAARYVVQMAAANRKLQIYFVNAHCINVAARDAAYARLLAAAPFLFADGIGMALAARLWGVQLANNVNGTDLFPLICRFAAEKSLPIAFLGARPGVAGACADHMKKHHPGLEVVWVEHGYHSPEAEEKTLAGLDKSGARILFVAKGVPGQEHWIAAHAGALAVPVVLGVGALFDFYSGSIPRAPQLMRDLRLEWLFRLSREPRRMFRRYVIGNPEFLARALMRRLVR